MDSVPQKQCSKCRDWLPETSQYFQFNKSRQRFEARCKPCDHEADNAYARAHRQANLEEERRQNREEQREFRQKNQERLRVKDRERRQRRLKANPEEERLKARIRYQKKMLENPQTLRNKGIRNNAKRRTRKLHNSTDIDFTTKDVEMQYKSQNGKCWWCEKDLEGKYHVDHRIPISRGGHNGAGNICVTCQTCNTSKNNKMPWEWGNRLI